MREPEVHRRQWVLGPAPVAFGDRWTSHDLGGELVLSWHDALPVRRLDGDRLVLGLAVATGPEATPADWAGRWVLIGDGRLFADAGSLLGPYVRSDGAGWRWASSSVAIMAGLDDGARRESSRPLRHGEPMDWYAPPVSRRRGIFRVLAGQSLNLADRTVEPRPATLVQCVGASDGMADAAARLEAAWRALGDSGPLWLPLTAGYDSRLLLASAVAAGVPLTTYTFDNPEMSRADREQPPALAQLAGVEHRLIGGGKRRTPVDSAFDLHCDGHHVGVDRGYLADGHWDAIPDDALVVRGGVFETARHFYHEQLPAMEAPTADAMSKAVARGFGLGEGLRRSGVMLWATWAAEHPWPGIDWRDRFYLEQRVGGWLAALEQALDVAAPERVHLASCDALLGALLSIPPEERVGSAHHEALIERMAPDLLELPFNPPEPPPRPPLLTRARIAAGRWRRALRQDGR